MWTEKSKSDKSPKNFLYLYRSLLFLYSSHSKFNFLCKFPPFNDI